MQFLIAWLLLKNAFSPEGQTAKKNVFTRQCVSALARERERERERERNHVEMT